MVRSIKNLLGSTKFATARQADPCAYVICKHNSLIRRRLGNVDMRLQENKAINLSIAAPKIDRVLIRPGETFSFWKLVGRTSAKKGYQEGLTISSG
ncbi:MAG: VanW family protein, partial [Lachnospiraceae bacterium]|nr:VanW family protein [Lachnospiraceae bacterium]